jgi:hypothetical protein
MKQQPKETVQQQEPRLEVVYSSKKELAAVHLITPNGIISYASLGPEPGPSKQKKQDAA